MFSLVSGVDCFHSGETSKEVDFGSSAAIAGLGGGDVALSDNSRQPSIRWQIGVFTGFSPMTSCLELYL